MAQTTPTKIFFTVRELASYLRLAPGTIYNQLNQNIFPIPHVRLGGKILFKISAVDAFLQGGADNEK